MPAKKKTATKKSVKMRDLKPSKDAKGGALIKPGVPGGKNERSY